VKKKKQRELHDSMKTGQLILDIDLSNILTAKEVMALSNYQYDNIELRQVSTCKDWIHAYNYFTHHPHYQLRCVWKRRCVELWGWYEAKAWTEYAYQCYKPGTA